MTAIEFWKKQDFAKKISAENKDSIIKHTKWWFELMEKYDKLKCKEQRKICTNKAEAYIDNSRGDYKEVPRVFTKSILNAPEPKFG